MLNFKNSQIVLVFLQLRFILAQDCNPLDITKCFANNGKCQWQTQCNKQIDCGINRKLACELLTPFCNWEALGKCEAKSDEQINASCMDIKTKDSCEQQNCLFENPEKCSFKQDNQLSTRCEKIVDENLCGFDKKSLGCEKQNKCIFDDNFECTTKTQDKNTCEGKLLNKTICKFTEKVEAKEKKCEIDQEKTKQCLPSNNKDKNKCEGTDPNKTVCKFTEKVEAKEKKCEIDQEKIKQCLPSNNKDKNTCEGTDPNKTVCKFTEKVDGTENKCEIDDAKKQECTKQNTDQVTCEGTDPTKTVCKFTEKVDGTENKCEIDDAKKQDCTKKNRNQVTCEGKGPTKTVCKFTKKVDGTENKCEVDDAKKQKKVQSCIDIKQDNQKCEKQNACKTTFDKCIQKQNFKCSEFQEKDQCENQGLCDFNPEAKDSCKGKPLTIIEKEPCTKITSQDQCKEKTTCAWNFDEKCNATNQLCTSFTLDTCPNLCIQGTCIEIPAIIAKREASGYILEQMGTFIALVYVLIN